MQWGPAATNAVAPITAVLPKTSCCKLRLRGLWSIHVSLMCISCLQLLLCEFRAQVSRKRGEAGQWQGIVTIINFSDDRLSGFYSMILCTVLQYILVQMHRSNSTHLLETKFDGQNPAVVQTTHPGFSVRCTSDSAEYVLVSATSTFTCWHLTPVSRSNFTILETA